MRRRGHAPAGHRVEPVPCTLLPPPMAMRFIPSLGVVPHIKYSTPDRSTYASPKTNKEEEEEEESVPKQPKTIRFARSCMI